MHNAHGSPARGHLTDAQAATYIQPVSNKTIGKNMNRGIFSGRLLGLLDIFGSAVGASSSIENRRVPDPRDLKRLGIDPERFREINRF
ncbi:MAG: hypothetical protein WBA44_16660 [Mesorhizobium sp.]